MRFTIHGLALVLVASSAAGLSAQSLRSERLVAPRLEDWKIGYYHTTSEASIRKEVPRGQTAQVWQRMVTTERLHDQAGTSPAAYAREFAVDANKACPGARVSPVRDVRKSGHQAAQVRIDCAGTAETGGKAETTILLAIAGQDELHVKQIAFRGGLGPADMPWAERFLSGVALCAEGDRAPACTR